MHSRIFSLREISCLENALPDYEEFDEDTLDFETYSYFGVDYVSKIEKDKWDEEIDWLIDFLGASAKINYKGEICFVLTKKNIEYFFLDRLNALRDKVEEISLDEFCDCYSTYSIKRLIDDEDGFHICVNNRYERTLMERLREIYTDMVRNHKDKALYQVLGILDYHC